MRNFEKLGMTREQSERLTRDLTEILCINKDKIAAQFVSKSTLEKVRHHVSCCLIRMRLARAPTVAVPSKVP